MSWRHMAHMAKPKLFFCIFFCIFFWPASTRRLDLQETLTLLALVGRSRSVYLTLSRPMTRRLGLSLVAVTARIHSSLMHTLPAASCEMGINLF